MHYPVCVMWQNFIYHASWWSSLQWNHFNNDNIIVGLKTRYKWPQRAQQSRNQSSSDQLRLFFSFWKSSICSKMILSRVGKSNARLHTWNILFQWNLIKSLSSMSWTILRTSRTLDNHAIVIQVLRGKSVLNIFA